MRNPFKMFFKAIKKISSKTPFLKDFVSTVPENLSTIHYNIAERMTKVEGTKPFEFTVLPNGKIAGRVDEDGFKGWCTNYVMAIKDALLKAGYQEEQIKLVHCSIYNTERPDHVVLFLTINKDIYIFDSAKKFVMRPKDYPKKLTHEGIIKGHLKYIWWAKADGDWISIEI